VSTVYALPSGANYGFLDEDGVASSVSNPLTTSKPPVNQLLGINDNGEAAGFYNDAKGNAHAYTSNRVTRVFTPLNVPGAASATATAINDHGTVGGFFTEANRNIASFIKQGSQLRPAAPVPPGDRASASLQGNCGRSSMAELQPSKLVVRVQFPSPARTKSLSL
jgi:uncharacterized membrane protein